MSHDIGDRMSHDIGNTGRAAMLGHVEGTPGDHRPARREARPRPRSPRRYGVSPVLGLPTHGPLRAPRARPRSSPGPDAPRPHPARSRPQTVELVLRLRKELHEAGLDAGADTMLLAPDPPSRRSRCRGPRSTASWPATARSPRSRTNGRSPPTSGSRPQMPNETWQSDFTHYRLTDTDGLPERHRDHHLARRLHPLRPARHRPPPDHHPDRARPPSAKPQVSTAIPASTLTDNGMVYTVRLAGGRQGGRNGLEHQLRDWNVVQKNSRPNHPTTCGKVERFQQTLKNWLRAQPDQPATIVELQALLDRFRTEYNHHRPHRSLPHRATPAPLYDAMPKALPGTEPRRRHPRPGPPRPRRQNRHRHPARQRPTPPHRHRPNPRPNPRHPARPGPRRPRRQRRHRRTPPRAHHRPQQGLPAPNPERQTPEPTFP